MRKNEDVFRNLERAGIRGDTKIPANPDAGEVDYDPNGHKPLYHVTVDNVVKFLFSIEQVSGNAGWFIDILSRSDKRECIRCMSYVACAKDMPEEYKIYTKANKNNETD